MHSLWPWKHVTWETRIDSSIFIFRTHTHTWADDRVSEDEKIVSFILLLVGPCVISNLCSCPPPPTEREQSHTRQGNEAIERARRSSRVWEKNQGIFSYYVLGKSFTLILSLPFTCRNWMDDWIIIVLPGLVVFCCSVRLACSVCALFHSSGQSARRAGAGWMWEVKERDEENHQTCNRRILFRLNSIKKIISSLFFFVSRFFSFAVLFATTDGPKRAAAISSGAGIVININLFSIQLFSSFFLVSFLFRPPPHTLTLTSLIHSGFSAIHCGTHLHQLCALCVVHHSSAHTISPN